MNPYLVIAQLYWKKQDPAELGLFLVGFLVLIALVVLYQIIRNGIGGTGLSDSGKASRFNRGQFRRAARQAGLGNDEAHFLEEFGRTLGISNPESLFQNRARLDSFFKEAYRSIEKNSDSESTAEGRKARLFAIRERFSESASGKTSISSTRQLGRNTPLSFITPGEESYPSLIVAVEPGGIAVEPIRDRLGEIIRFRRGTKLTCFFYAAGRQGYQFQTKVSGFSSVSAKETMTLSHSDSIAALPTRNHARREMRVPCAFHHVAVSTKTARGKEKASARVEKIAYPGTVLDISAGGIGIQTANPLAEGEFVKIEFDAGSGTHAAFGKVVRLNRLKGSGGMMHIQFVKISQKSLNAVMSYVFGYSD